MESPVISPTAGPGPSQQPQMALLDFFFPGFSVLSGVVQRTLGVSLNLYIPLLAVVGALIFAWRYFTEYLWDQVTAHFMSAVDIRVDDEVYNYVMSWVAGQRFAQTSRRFVVNTNVNSRNWYASYRSGRDDDSDDDDNDSPASELSRARKALHYTPTFGTHYFWYRGRLLQFSRTENPDQSNLVTSEREQISISCFGRDPWILKELLLEARMQYLKRDKAKTVIYRGTSRGTSDPSWQRSMARPIRPLSTVILNEKVKQDLITDVTDYLNPTTRRWYSNRGIPFRRGYLLYGPPGTGKSSLSLALAGHFKMCIYIVSLSSVTASEENLADLFASLPRRCVVLLEDIDTAGLTHTREEAAPVAADRKIDEDGSKSDKSDKSASGAGDDAAAPAGDAPPPPPSGRLSLSGLLNILDGVASQEGRVLVMTTNHLEKLDKALIRPGRIDMIVKFDLADHGMVTSIFRAIFAPLEGDAAPPAKLPAGTAAASAAEAAEAERERAAAGERKAAETARVERLAEEFARRIPAHEFSPAELQGYLMKNKREPEAALAGAAAWVAEARKEKQEKQLKAAEAKRRKDHEAAEAARKKEEAEAAKGETPAATKEETPNKEAEEAPKDKEADSGYSTSTSTS